MEIEPKEYYTPRELAERYDVSPKTIDRLIINHNLKALRIGRRWRILGEEIIRYEDKNMNY